MKVWFSVRVVVVFSGPERSAVTMVMVVVLLTML